MEKLLLCLFTQYHVLIYPLLEDHFVLDTSQLGDANLHNITVIEILRLLHSHSDATWCSCENNSSSLKRCSLADEADNLLDTEKKIIRTLALSLLAVDSCCQVQLGSITNDSWRDEKRSNGCELVETLAEAPLGNAAGLLGVSLPCSSGYIVGDDVACYVRESIFLSDVLAGLANHDALHIVVSQFLGKRIDQKLTSSPS